MFWKKRTNSVEAHFGQKGKNIKKWWNPKHLRIFEAQPIFTGSYKKECFEKYDLILDNKY